MYAHESAGRFDNVHGDEVDGYAAVQVAPAYCDYLASLVQCMDEVDSESLIQSIGKVEFDLHPKHGYLVSTKKSVVITDTNGKQYRVTVEEV